MSLHGITKDLEWMKRVGIAGFQLSDLALEMIKVDFGTDEWYRDVKSAVGDIANVSVNGLPTKICWKATYTVDVTDEFK